MEEVLKSIAPEPMRVLLLTQWFDPEPTFKGLAFAKELIRQGVNVEVVTGFPNYPTGKLYPGYRIKLIHRQTIDDIKVTRVALYPSHDRSAIRRVLNYVSFAVTSLFYCLFFTRRVDIIYAYHPPLTVGITASLIRVLRGIPVVYDIQDLWPDTLRTTGMLNNEKILFLVGLVCKHIYQQVNQIVVLSPGFKTLLMQRGVPEGKIEVIYNWSDEHKLNEPIDKSNYQRTSKSHFCVLFAGNMGTPQALGAVLEAVDLLNARGVAVEMIFVGTGLDSERLKKIATARNLTNVLFYPPVPMSEIGHFLDSADALLVHLKADELFKVTIPSKTQAYMAAGKPLLMAVEGDAAELVTLAGCGVLAKPEDPKSIADAVQALAAMTPSQRKQMGQRGREYYMTNLSLSAGTVKFKQLFEDVLQKSKTHH
ncbi:glycosyltransferase family 4 protein [beta proteobacterium MWH-UniP1]